MGFALGSVRALGDSMLVSMWILWDPLGFSLASIGNQWDSTWAILYFDFGLNVGLMAHILQQKNHGEETFENRTVRKQLLANQSIEYL